MRRGAVRCAGDGLAHCTLCWMRAPRPARWWSHRRTEYGTALVPHADRYSESRGSWGVAKVPTVVVEVEQEDGLIGVGVSTGGEAACFIIEQHLSMFIEGTYPP